MKGAIAMDFDKTMSFQVEREENTKAKEILKDVYAALTEKGYNPNNYMATPFNC